LNFRSIKAIRGQCSEKHWFVVPILDNNYF
jgi:hypothetical protein